MNGQADQQTSTPKQKSLRSACDTCHHSKVKCSGRLPCEGCEKLRVRCKYSISNRTGRPKGVRNKKTLERIKHLSMSSDSAPETVQPESDESSFFAVQSRIMPKETPNPPIQSAVFQPYSDPDQHANASIVNPFDFFSMSDIPGYLNAGVGEVGTGEKHGTCGDEPLSPSSFEAITTHGFLHTMEQDIPWPTDLNLSSADNTTKPVGPTKYVNDKTTTTKHDRDSTYSQQEKPSKEAPSSRSRTPSIGTCDCLQQLADQLAQIKALSRVAEPLKADSILSVTREALHRWRRQLQCNICQQNDDKDILVLSVMGFRAIISLIRRLGQAGDSFWSYQYNTNTTISNISPIEPIDTDTSFLGMYELSQEEKRLMANVLLTRALRDLSRTVEDVKARSSKQSSLVPTPTSSGSNDDRSTGSSLGMQFPINSTHMMDIDKPGYGLDIGPVMDIHNNEYLQRSLQRLSRSIDFLSDALKHPHYSPQRSPV
ncbi:hypothetical protein BGW36DRAFT_144779 [Talaromyces proteolyticus]|uniref:Zn(2)-C6 fungal-type domain-containing protein n=1 Tax=Talaromyces proteolyticus TaxID=1131652 RepID=A0AAD4KWC9_9EURO|nr:uncharacterized protein BGW36DRAFT_144779 [Talaromyces proteolyticus]KAH8698373.1 hypothetical protein BGW36DRAFT_144779 [Talaromyces proteolyticus]